MVKYLEPKYLVYLVIASVIAIVVLQASGDVPPLQPSPPAEHNEAATWRNVRERVAEPIAGRPGRWDERSRWR
jgi:hypothetical protein